MKIDDGTSPDLIDRRAHAGIGAFAALVAAIMGWVGLRSPGAAPPDPDADLVAIVSTAIDRGQSYWSSKIDGYRRAKVVIYAGATATACGDGRAEMGPFYCPGDERIYIDLSFLRSIPSGLGRAYVVAHELGHHVQRLRGQFGSGSVPIELGADCYAGEWMANEARQNDLEPGDIEGALAEAAAVGDDRICPSCLSEQWTHGSSKDRSAAVQLGVQGGCPANGRPTDADLAATKPLGFGPFVNGGFVPNSGGGSGANGGSGTFQSIAVQMVQITPQITPAAITGSVDDWDPGAGSGYTWLHVQTVDATGATLNGVKVYGAGQWIHVCNSGPGALTLPSGAITSAVANRWRLSGVTQITIPNQVCKDFYNYGTSGWFLDAVQNNPLDDGVYFRNGAFGTADQAFATSTQLSARPYAEVAPTSSVAVTDPPPQDFSVLDNSRTFDTTAGALGVTGFVDSMVVTRSAGANNLAATAAQFGASGCQPASQCYAIQTIAGNEYHGLGTQMTFYYANTALFDESGIGVVETTLKVGGGDFSTTTLQQIAEASTAPTANHGTLSGDSSNFVGEITSIGSNTSVTLTFGAGGFNTTSHCVAMVEGSATVGIQVSTVSATAPIFSCFTLASGAAANCPNFNYQCWGH